MSTAVRDGEDDVLNGAKRYITNAPMTGLITVMARTAADRLPGNAHVTPFLVPAGTPACASVQRIGRCGRGGALSADVFPDDVRVPATAVLGGKEGFGFRTAMKVLDRGRIHVAAVCVGQPWDVPVISGGLNDLCLGFRDPVENRVGLRLTDHELAWLFSATG